ncbi:hypothetical protein D6C90_09764 [Aureobasidium pullulans]|uniref:Uncharacterized protein n=1 Tax=Aureobasidium pullulans TaxID=5580 RepID=A0A4S9DRT4_AURPU|nr:hypothetical protein D6D12_08112 [Aureobasidium pullulans]THX63122.1 hypothetical protein D6D11_02014 [Aureobasidium pullulans]THZ18703.1 hypothetical protein D6C90_09764 [Aureobasidium pullulans]
MKHEPQRTFDPRHFHKLFAANKPVAGVDRMKSQTETIDTNKSSPNTLKIDGNMIEETNVQPNKFTKEKEAEPKNTLNKDKIHDTQPTCVSSQKEAAVFDDIPSKKRKAADRPSTKVNEIQKEDMYKKTDMYITLDIYGQSHEPVDKKKRDATISSTSPVKRNVGDRFVSQKSEMMSRKTV